MDLRFHYFQCVCRPSVTSNATGRRLFLEEISSCYDISLKGKDDTFGVFPAYFRETHLFRDGDYGYGDYRYSRLRQINRRLREMLDTNGFEILEYLWREQHWFDKVEVFVFELFSEILEYGVKEEIGDEEWSQRRKEFAILEKFMNSLPEYYLFQLYRFGIQMNANLMYMKFPRHKTSTEIVDRKGIIVKVSDGQPNIALGAASYKDGVHYWELEIVAGSKDICIGILKENADLPGNLSECESSCSYSSECHTCQSGKKLLDEKVEPYSTGDVIGIEVNWHFSRTGRNNGSFPFRLMP